MVYNQLHVMTHKRSRYSRHVCPIPASLEDRSLGRVAFDLGELRRVVSVRPEHVVKGHHRRGAVVALQERMMKEVITGATEAAIAESGGGRRCIAGSASQAVTDGNGSRAGPSHPLCPGAGESVERENAAIMCTGCSPTKRHTNDRVK